MTVDTAALAITASTTASVPSSSSAIPKDKDAVAEAVLTVKEGEEDDEAVIKTVPIEGVHEKG